MDMEELSKSQIVLLTLLVSFVTSIATGIVTVSLMDQAPPAIAQTVNRIVERTVEKVVPSGQTASSVVTTEKTIVVKESELIAKAVEKVRPSLVHIYASSSEPVFLGLGIIVDADGDVVSDVSAIGEVKNIMIALADGTRVSASPASRDSKSGVATLRAATTTADGKIVQFTPATLSVGSPTLGQTIVVLSGKTISRITDGLVTALIPRDEGGVAVIDTNVSADFVMDGSPLIDTEGGVIGVSTSVSRASSPAAFMPTSVLVKQPEESPAATE
ncbi:trypsin-like peptidase domain-containing protein [Candidatus Kaiserbacteria bacterium]|nr:trypsin-like peptidase domain-containing protein [Candidatus Kaiserbacteria bacterium]